MAPDAGSAHGGPLRYLLAGTVYVDYCVYHLRWEPNSWKLFGPPEMSQNTNVRNIHLSIVNDSSDVSVVKARWEAVVQRIAFRFAAGKLTKYHW